MTAFRAERGRRRVGCASLAIVATVALLAGGASAASARISNHRDPNKSAPRICRQFAGDTQATANCLLAQPLPNIDRLYASLHAGPMPGWRKPGHGTFRCVWLEACGSQASVQLLNTVVPLVWGGKTFFTHKKGGWLWNRPAPLENGLVSGPVDGNTGVLIGNVQYGPSYLDGNRAVTITYQGLPDAPLSVGGVKVVSGAPDDCRTFERKLWLCNAWYDFRPASAPQRWAVFTLDFTKKGA